MRERDVRDRIARFLQKTARTVAVPASMGLGLTAAGCDRHSLHGRAADAGPDLMTQNSDVATNPPDLADALTKDDLPLIAVPYLVVLVEDAADAVPDSQETQGVDADRDAFAVPPDLGADLPNVVPPYLLPPQPDVGPDFYPPPPPYIVPYIAPDELPGAGAQGTPPGTLTPPEKQ